MARDVFRPSFKREIADPNLCIDFKELNPGVMQNPLRRRGSCEDRGLPIHPSRKWVEKIQEEDFWWFWTESSNTMNFFEEVGGTTVASDYQVVKLSVINDNR